MSTHWHVLGAGAMGCLFATALQRARIPCTLLLRDRLDAAPQPVLVERHGELRRYPVDLQGAADSGPINHLLVTTKAYDIRAAIATVRPRLCNNSRILLLANGMGYVDELRADRLTHPLYCGTTTEGAYRLAQRHIRHAGRGETRIGLPHQARSQSLNNTPDQLSTPAWFQQLSSAISDCHWDRNIDEALWLKLVINCAINPLTALNRCPNGALTETPSLAAQVEQLCDEMVPLSRALGFNAVADCLYQKVRQVISATAANRSSMLQDVEAGRRTEIDYISGHLISKAERLGMKASLNEELLGKIRELSYTVPRQPGKSTS